MNFYSKLSAMTLAYTQPTVNEDAGSASVCVIIQDLSSMNVLFSVRVRLQGKTGVLLNFVLWKYTTDG